jgi:hypothetical protein
MQKLITIILLFSLNLSAQENYKLMFYNVLNYPSSNPSKASIFKNIIDYTNPDLLMLTEITSNDAVDLLLEDALNVGSENSWQNAPFIDGPDSDNLLFFKSNLFTLVETNVINTALRDINEYVLYLNQSISFDTTYIYVYISHLKAGNDKQNAIQRTLEVTALKNYINQRTNGEHFIVSGDFNVYGAEENAYQALLNFGVRLNDPIDQEGEWHNNSFYSNIHTQSTRTNNLADGGSIGGMDDRFDFILISDDLLSGQLSYIPNSYQSFGQDGNHFNLSYNNITNDVVPPYINDALYNMSDHLPVIMELKYDHKVSSIKGSTKNNVPKLLAIKDILGRNVDPNNNGLQFHIYDNGIVEKKLVDN